MRLLTGIAGCARAWVDHAGHASALKYDACSSPQCQRGARLTRRQFLRQTHKVSPHERRTGKFHCHVDFAFRIASCCFPSEGTRPQLANLPPSFSSGEACLDREGNTCMQPLISYGFRAVILHRPSSGAPRIQQQKFIDIAFSPWTEIYPPITIEDFPGEYRLDTTGSIRRRLSRCVLGALTVSTTELSPLFSGTYNKETRTRGLLRMSFESCEKLMKDRFPRWSCEIRLEIVRTIYYSTMPLTEVASDHLLRDIDYLRKREEVVHTQRWTVNPLHWDKPLSDTRLTAYIPLTIQPAVQLAPTFSMPLVTVRYSCRTALRLPQVSHSPLEVEVPLQVHNTPHAVPLNARRNSSELGCSAMSADQRASEVLCSTCSGGHTLTSH